VTDLGDSLGVQEGRTNRKQCYTGTAVGGETMNPGLLFAVEEEGGN